MVILPCSRNIIIGFQKATTFPKGKLHQNLILLKVYNPLKSFLPFAHVSYLLPHALKVYAYGSFSTNATSPKSLYDNVQMVVYFNIIN
jgi:hypothetical protein